MAVVQQQNVAGGKPRRQARIHRVGIAVDSIKTTPRPACQSQFESRQHWIEQGTAQTRGSAKENRAPACYIADSLLGARNFIAECTRPEQGKDVEVAVAVVFDHVPTMHDFAPELGIFLNALADAEKRRLGLILIKNIEHTRRDRALRAIINTEGDLAAPRSSVRQLGQVRAQERAARP